MMAFCAAGPEGPADFAHHEKTLSAKLRGLLNGGRSAALDANYIGRLKALGAFQEIELHCFAFVQRAISVLLDRRKMYEDVLPGGALDKTVSFCPIEPLHCALLSHKCTPFSSAVVGILPRAPRTFPKPWKRAPKAPESGAGGLFRLADSHVQLQGAPEFRAAENLGTKLRSPFGLREFRLPNTRNIYPGNEALNIHRRTIDSGRR